MSDGLLRPPYDEVVRRQVTTQLFDIAKHGLWKCPSISHEFLKLLCEAELGGDFDKEDADAQSICKEAYTKAHKNPKEKYDRKALPDLLESLASRLEDYFDPALPSGQYKVKPKVSPIRIIRILIQPQAYRVQFSSIDNSEASATAVPGDPFSALRQNLHHYHLTEDEQGRPVWVYAVLRYVKASAKSIGVVRHEGNLRGHLFDFECRPFGKHLLMILRLRSDPDADVTVALFPSLVASRRRFYGARINDTFHPPTVASSIAILSTEALAEIEERVVEGDVSENMGAVLQKIWDDSESIDRLPPSESVIDAATPQDLMLLKMLVAKRWVGEMADVYRGPKALREESERITLTFRQEAGRIIGILLVERHDGRREGRNPSDKAMTVVLKLCDVRERRFSFTYTNADPSVPHQGVMLLNMNSFVNQIRGLYSGWSPWSEVYQCGKLMMTAEDALSTASDEFFQNF